MLQGTTLLPRSLQGGSSGCSADFVSKEQEIIMGEKTSVSKNNDCYFYYYSSCSKGDACPFRHEPSALRNETMCYYWKLGNCNKANCFYRHMEITKKRDRIACYFESQPGGCKKPHCPFQHQNILDHPREEDIKKMPDLILPVKKEIDGGKNDKLLVEAKEPERQVIPPSHSADCDTPPRQVQPTAKPPNPVIVPLQDGESDSESVSGTPQKRRDPDLRLSAELEWELRRLRQIQEHEANLIGYTFEDDEENQEQMEEEVAAENEEETEEVCSKKHFMTLLKPFCYLSPPPPLHLPVFLPNLVLWEHALQYCFMM
ncbi:zinc finger CCCH domain-containing protein 11B-like [Penaeus monodon]|uniref:zinc finger CCCH domain-containing protein 11B-like n=1 Tax=Penaeus monodon TaxID=6687 RepID=UPI0018A77243|nr:zinc finger CCCH domain-containing protein 11B-like [Penaeus monodon]